MPVVLLNAERVCREVSDVFRLMLSEEAGVPAKDIMVSFSLQGGRVVPQIDVETKDELLALEESVLKNQVAKVWHCVKAILTQRLQDLGSTRVKTQEKITAASSGCGCS